MKAFSAVVGLTAGVMLLVPLVVAGGLLALIALPALGITRSVRGRLAARRREPPVGVLALGPAQLEAGLDALGQRAA